MGSFEGKVAITGGIAEGKSTVLGCLAELGYRVASSDEISRQVLEAPNVQAELGRVLGKALPVTAEDLRQRIWTDPDVRREVNGVMHPEILRALEDSDAQFLEIPLLIETCLQANFQRVWVVTCGPEEQRRRLIERVGDPSKADDILATQLPTEVKLAFADVIVRTNRPLADVNSFVAAMAGRSLLQ